MPSVKLLLWTTKDGREIPVREMTDEHLVNTIRMLSRNSEQRFQEALSEMSTFAESHEIPEPQWFDHPMWGLLRMHARHRGLDI